MLLRRFSLSGRLLLPAARAAAAAALGFPRFLCRCRSGLRFTLRLFGFLEDFPFQGILNFFHLFGILEIRFCLFFPDILRHLFLVLVRTDPLPLFCSTRALPLVQALAVVNRIRADFKGVPHRDAHAHFFTQYIDGRDIADSVRRFHFLAHLGHALSCLLVIVLLIFEAAHQAVADSGNLGRVKGQVLLLGHFDGHRLEIHQELTAADGAAAGAEPAEHFRLVPNADLAQLDSRLEHAGQALDQKAEIHASVSGKVKGDLGAVKRILHVHQLHIQLLLRDFLLRDVQRPNLAFLILLLDAQVLPGAYPQNRLEQCGALLIHERLRIRHAFPDFHPADRLGEHLVPAGNLQVVGFKII